MRNVPCRLVVCSLHRSVFLCLLADVTWGYTVPAYVVYGLTI